VICSREVHKFQPDRAYCSKIMHYGNVTLPPQEHELEVGDDATSILLADKDKRLLSEIQAIVNGAERRSGHGYLLLLSVSLSLYCYANFCLRLCPIMIFDAYDWQILHMPSWSSQCYYRSRPRYSPPFLSSTLLSRPPSLRGSLSPEDSNLPWWTAKTSPTPSNFPRLL
jgi:hypothetical protein